MPDKLSMMLTTDGSHTLVNERLAESYHSRHGALQESRHVYINEGLNHYLATHPESVKIFEMGLGTGLNLILTIEVALAYPNVSFAYTALDSQPLEWPLLKQLNYTSLMDSDNISELFKKIHLAQWNNEFNILPNFKITKINSEIESYNFDDTHYDIIYYDAFAPNKQPELWGYNVMQHLYGTLVKYGIFVTYCSKGQLKRDLKTLGFKIESPPGPPGKAQIIRATKL